MQYQILTFLISVLILIGGRIVLGAVDRRGHSFLSDNPLGGQRWSAPQLFLASFLTLFAELAFIRWIAVEVRVFAYFKNLALLLCFVGFGLGCAIANKTVRWKSAVTALFGLLLVIRFPFFQGEVLEGLSENLGGGADVEIWRGVRSWNWMHFSTAAILTSLFLLMLIWIFIPLGQIVGRQLNYSPRPLAGYSWNLAASLLGILCFLGASRFMWPPWTWLGIVLIGFAFLQGNLRDRRIILASLVPMFLLLYTPSTRNRYTIWTPYQQIEFARSNTTDGQLLRAQIQVNHTGYQTIVNLSPQFLSQHPDLLKESPEDNPYNMAFRFATPAPRVLIVGSGAGNDVAGALRNQSSSVDAVEIDPAILALGKREHPEQPYASSRVSVHLTDARAFLRRTKQQYDLILFGLLDSHTQLSDYSNMRIDNFVYTEESFREARAHLSPDGVLFIKFQVDRPWMGGRIAKMLTQVFGKTPVIFNADSSYSSTATCFAISPSARIEQALASDPNLARFVKSNLQLFPTQVPVTTDDWPYLYQEGRRIPRAYISLGILVLIVSLLMYLQIPEARHAPPSLFYFCMGAGFLLLEAQVISRLALYYGTTWQVNGIVISAMLAALLLSNLVVEYSHFALPRILLLAAIVIGLAIAYFIPLHWLPVSPAMAGAILAGVFSVPVFFAGLLFSTEFRTAASPSAALGANALGAVVGGLLENLSLITGMHALIPVAIVLYLVAGAALLVNKKKRNQALVGPSVIEV
jgi:spermidine synthase